MSRRMRIQPGLTLMEILVVIGVFTLLLGTTLALAQRTWTIHARTSVRIEPQASQMLALKRMERDIREAMLIHIANATSTEIEVVLPDTDPQTGLNIIVENPETKRLGLRLGKTVRYFLGVKQYPDPGDTSQWIAVPSIMGDTIFKISAPTGSSLPIEGTFPQAEVVISGILSIPMVPDPLNGGQERPGAIFTFWPANDNGTPDDLSDDTPTVNTRLIKITLSIPLTMNVPVGNSIENHTLWTQFCLRNLQTTQESLPTP